MIEIVLGDEYDDALFARLVAAVEAIGGSITKKEWLVAGSQEINAFEISLPDGTLEAVAETYVGLSLRGESSLVEPLAHRLVPNPSFKLVGRVERSETHHSLTCLSRVGRAFMRTPCGLLANACA